MTKPGKSGPASSRLKSKASALNFPKLMLKRKSPLKSDLERACRSLRSQSVASALDLRAGATPAENNHTTRNQKHSRFRSHSYMAQPVTISVMLLNGLTGRN